MDTEEKRMTGQLWSAKTFMKGGFPLRSGPGNMSDEGRRRREYWRSVPRQWIDEGGNVAGRPLRQVTQTRED